MFKRFIIGILTIALAATMLCGCSFFEHNTERDYQQVVATISEYYIVNDVKVEVEENGKLIEKNEPKTYRTKPVTIYKKDLVDYINNNYSNLAQSYSTKEEIVNYALEVLIDSELVVNEAEALIDAGLAEWGQAQKNAVKKSIYGIVDNTLVSLRNSILTERDKPSIDNNAGSADSSSTTYPVKPEPEAEKDDGPDTPDEQPWEPELSRYPGVSGDLEARSLGREAMRRFISLIKDRVKDDFRLTEEDKAKFEADDALIKEITESEGVEYVYRIIGDTHYMYYLSGRNIERTQKITELQKYLTESVTVSSEEVMQSFTNTLNEQRSSYDADATTFDSAMSGSDTVLYYPNNNYFYVKHILLPFTDAQKDELSAYKDKLNVTEEQIKAKRQHLVEGIVCYPHVDGEDDLSHPMTVDEVMAEIRAVMRPLESDITKADTAFDDLIYLYNTDPGAFNNNKGYVVNKDKESNNYMEEFTDAALYMRENLTAGQVYYEPVVTDYGVHIMYLASTTKVGAVGLNDYTTPGKVQTYYDILSEPIRSARENTVYSSWEANILNFNYNDPNKVQKYPDRYEDLWED